ncbi:MAG: LamG-like jellyroll fold domain-containing protein, partial [Xanthobacteraceae bacterium]
MPLNGILRRATLLAMILSAAVMLLASPVRAQQTCVAPPQGILAWWPFDETAGPTAAELIAGRVGTYFGSPPPVPAPGEVGNGLQFNGSTAFVGVADDPVWHFGVNDFSIELWANFTAPTGGSIGEPSDIFIGNDDGPGDQNKWFFALGGGYLNFHINSPTLGPMFFPLAPFTPALNTWYHLAVTRAGALYTLYINGTPVASATNTASIPSPSAFLTIGEAENIGFVNGLLDEVTIYNRALTAAEIQSIWAAGTAGKCKPSSGPALAIASVNPVVGGNAGQVTVSISGAGFQPGAVVNLASGSQTLVQGTNTGSSSPGLLQTTFDLTSLSAQSALVQVVNPDGTSAAFPFTVMSGGAPQVNLEIVGPATARVGRTAPFVALLQNVGSVNAPYVTVTSTFSCPASGPTTPVPVTPITSGGPVFDPPTSPIQVPLPSAPPVFPSPVLLALQLPTGIAVPLQLPISIPVPSPGSPCTVHVEVHWSDPPPPDFNPLDDPLFCSELDLEEILDAKAEDLLN